MEGLAWQTLQFYFNAGLNQKADVRALQAPELAVALNVQCDEVGGLQLRKPYLALSTDIFPSGTIADPRRLATFDDELLLFTKDTLYSWNAEIAKWVSKGTHLAIKVDETSRFVSDDDAVCCDRAECNDTIVYVWEAGAGVYAAAIDKTTGSVLMAPTLIDADAKSPKVIGGSTRIFFGFANAATNPDLIVRIVDPDSPTTGLTTGGTTIVTTTNFAGAFDMCRVFGADQVAIVARRVPDDAYEVATLTAGATLDQETKAFTLDTAGAIACTADGTELMVVRDVAGDILADRIVTSTLGDAEMDQALGTYNGGLNQVAAAFRTVADSGEFRCYAFWSSAQTSGSTSWVSKFNWADTGGGTGSEATFITRLGIASRAFDHGGRVFVWGVFAGESTVGGSLFRAALQNTYFLYRDDQTLHSKAAGARAGGFSSRTGHLPNVALTSGSTTYSWCGVRSRVIELGGVANTGYGARSPQDITFTFDSNEARRTSRLGSTMYVTGGEILQFDGVKLVELGWHVYPWHFGTVSEQAAGTLLAGDYTYKATLRATNGKGEQDRSTTATTATGTIAAAPGSLRLSNITSSHYTRRTVGAIEIWRTVVNPGEDSPFYLVTGKDPSDTTTPNDYLVFTPTDSASGSFDDDFIDTTLIQKESNPENGAVLENIVAPGASIIVATDQRLFLAGVAGDPHRIWYSKQRVDGDVASFHDALTADVPRAGGDITGLGFQNETLIVFKETAVYAMPGDGYDNATGGTNYGPARSLSLDVGAVNHESIALTPHGLIFKSRKGWYLLRGWSVEYIGHQVSDYDSETVASVEVVETQHQVRCVLSSTRVLVWDYSVNQWFEWTIADGIDATMWNGTYVYLPSSGAPKTERTTYTGVDYSLDVETAWIKPADLQGRFRVRHVHVLGENRSTHFMKVKVARDYLMDGSTPLWFDSVFPAVQTLNSTVGSPLAVRHMPTRPRDLMAIKFRLTTFDSDLVSPPPGEACKLTGLSIEWAPKRGAYRRQNNAGGAGYSSG